MKWPLYLLLCFPALVNTQNSFGQDSTSTISVVISPALFVPVSLAVQAGLQFRLSRRWTLMVEGAYPTFYPGNTEYESIRYWRAGIETRHYVSKKKMGKYLSLQVNYLFRELVQKEEGVYYSQTQTFAYKDALIKSPVLSAALKIGLEVPIGKKTYIDLFGGAGIRTIFTNYVTENSLATSIPPNKPSFFQFDDAWAYNYTLNRLHLTAGFRFGIWL